VLLDTSVVIDLERIDLGEDSSAPAAVSAVTVAELAYGLNVHDPIKRHQRTERYYTTLEQFEVLPFDITAASLYGTLAGLVREGGRDSRPRRMDLQIAAIAVAHSLVLLTRNPVDFTGLERLLRMRAV
jgi:predicted nucleic acid-binding protein